CHTHLLHCYLYSRPPTTALSPLSLHDALPISRMRSRGFGPRIEPKGTSLEERPTRNPGAYSAARALSHLRLEAGRAPASRAAGRSEEHTSELQSLRHLVCRLLLEKKK